MLRELWFRWKALRLPWRKRFLAGVDLQGNTFWEFRDQLGGPVSRFRRIVQYTSKVHHSDVNIPPPWIQWLRHTRRDAPSVEEQQMDVLRQERMRVLAAESDARWAEKPSFLVAPVPAPAAAQKGGGAGSKVVGDGEGEGPVTGRSSDLDKASRAYNVAGEKGQRESPKVVVTQQDLRGHEGHQTSATPETSAKSEPKKSPWAASSKTRDEPQPWNPKAVRRR